MSDEEFFEKMKEVYKYKEEELKELMDGWHTFHPIIKKMMKSLFNRKYTTIYQDWKVLDGVVRHEMFNAKLESL